MALLAMVAGLAGAAQMTNGVAASTNSAVAAAPATNVAARVTSGTAAPAAVARPSTNPPPATASASPPLASAATSLDETAFRIIAERNIFNANRSGGTVRLSTRRPSVVESFTLVGTLAYEKGVFAFFEGTSSEFTKVLKPAGIIAGHKLVDVYVNSVKLDVDGKEIELPLGSQMRREDEGTWHVAEARGGSGAVSNGEADSASRYSRSDRSRESSRSRRDGGSSSARGARSESSSPAPAQTSSSNANQDEILKRLMERREKESQ